MTSLTFVALLSTLCIALAAPSAAAQIFDPKSRAATPVVWLSAGIGWLDLSAIEDGATNSAWDFRSGVQYRGSLEVGELLGRGTSVGVSGSYSHTPMVYYQSFRGGEEPSQRIDAHADLTTIMATFRAGGGAGVHQVIEVSAGATRYSHFTVDAGGATLPPTSDTDFAFAIAYGFGYTFRGGRAQAVLTQEFGLALHQKSGLPNDANTSLRHQVTRFGLRVGLGGGKGGPTK